MPATDSAEARGLCLIEVLLVCACLATGIATLCIWIFYWIEGIHYASLIRYFGDLVWLWLRYAAAFGVSGVLAWLLAHWLSRALGENVATITVLVGCSAPVLLGLFATRFTGLDVASGRTGMLALTFVSLVTAGSLMRLRPVLRRFAFPVLVSAPPVLTTVNLLAWLRPSEFASAPKLALALGVCTLAAMGAMALLWPIHPSHGHDRIRRLTGRLVVAIGIFVATSTLPAFRSSIAERVDGVDAARRTSVLLIVVDTLRADAVSAGGSIADGMPGFQSFASDSVVFSRAMAAAPWTTPSFASILTSTYPSEHRAGSRSALGYKQALIERLPTLSSVFRDHGYWTGAVLTNAYLGRRFGFDRESDCYENLLAIEWAHPVLVGLARQEIIEIPPFVRAPRQTERILEVVRRGRSSGRPFFVLAHYMDPHLPYRKGVEGSQSQEPDEVGYHAEIESLDRSIGVLMRELERDGLYDDLLIVLTADHGEELDEKRGFGAMGHGHTLFGEVLHVPLIVKRPRNQGGGERRDDLVSSIDIAPTILGLLGLDIPVEFRGRALLSGEKSADPIFAERSLYGIERKAAMLGSKKIVLELPPEGGRSMRAYDLTLDPEERRPLAADDEAFRPLASALEAFADRDVEPDDTEHAEMDPRFKQRLEALGYGE